MKLPDFLKSSADPAQLSLTIKGLIVFVPALVALMAMFGLNVTPESMTEFINQVAVAIGALMTLYGIVRRQINKKAP